MSRSKSKLEKFKNFVKYEPRKFFLIVSAILVLLLGAWIWHLTGSVPRVLLYPLWLACVSVVTFVFYGYDKRQAQRTGQDKHDKGDKDEPFAARVPEVVLHVLSLAGGFIGAYCGRKFFRHKTQKKIFTFVIVLAAILHAAFALWLYF